jgi:hypothetical protein
VLRVPTGEVDRILTVAVDGTAGVPLLVIRTLRRTPDQVSDRAFRPVHTITLQAQYAELLIERIRAALIRSTPTEAEHAS